MCHVVICNSLFDAQHIPALWKLAGSVSVAARIACANLVPLLYMNLSELQQLRIRGLINRLMVDSVGAVRAYVLSSVCVRILRAVVQRQYNKDEDDGSSCSDALGTGASVTLNWIAHCMIQGSTDIEVDVRKGSLLACKNLIEYSALGTEEEGGVNCDLIEEMRTYISDNISLPTFVPEKVLRPQLSEVHILCCRSVVELWVVGVRLQLTMLYFCSQGTANNLPTGGG